jgi:two-component system response regulator FlrC
MVTAYGTVTRAVEAMQAGAADFITKPFNADELLRVVERVIALSQEQKNTLAALPQKNSSTKPIITNNPVMIRLLEVAEAVARSDATVLLQGESGTGKELVARFIHSSSLRCQMPFVAVNCAALPDTLLESELFGHEKGSFTGAQQRKLGKFEMAHGGTILLDEISEMALTLQAKLLRVLQEREVDRVGGRDPVSIDVRVIATTNRNLEESVAKGEFRADLFYRLNVIPLTIPPLRARRSDVELLVKHFMRRYLGNQAPLLSQSVLASLVEYNWPGNVRELQNAVERAAILSRGEAPSESDFLLENNRIERNYTAASHSLEERAAPQLSRLIEKSHSDNQIEAATPERNESFNKTEALIQPRVIRSGLTVAEMEKILILETLKSTSYNRSQAAKLLGISIRTLRNKLHEYRAQGVVIGEDNDQAELSQ